MHQRVYRFSDFKDIYPRYFFYYISSLFSTEIDKGSAKSTVASVRLPMLSNFVFCLPPPYEQEAIVDFLDTRCAEIDGLIAEKEALIADLEAYKKSLIFECVTGKRKIA
ncbi:MAG: restriction endonuclease subunit S [Desulfovibrio sp.]|nr:restriction endonuclease subunit S [Desulfovibrio sp.]